MTDSCIITKFDISEREKAIKKAFFKGKKEKIPEVSRRVEEDEVINKLIDDNFKNKPAVQQTGTSPFPVNLIYSQNKILERNVDVLQEQQRSIHDLLVYNLQHNKDKRETGLKAEIIDENKKLIKEIIGPLYSNMEGLKTSMEKLVIDSRNGKQQDDYLKKVNEASSLNYKVNDMIGKHSEFKENVVERKLVKTNDTVLLKAIDEVKNSISHINNEMNKMEENFSSNFKSILIEKEKKNLMGKFHTSTSLPQHNKLEIARQEKKQVESFNYKEIKDEMLDINQRKDEILNEFMINKLKIPKLKPPKGKINFSFSLDDEDTDVSKRSIKKTKQRNKSSNNKMKESEEVFTPSSSNIYTKKEKNIFLNNMEQEEFFREKRHQQETHNNNNLGLRDDRRGISLSPQERKTEYEETNIAESMKKVADKLKSNKLMSPSSNSMNMSTQPSSAKYRKTIGLSKEPLHVIKETNYVEEKPKVRDLGVSGINKVEKEIPVEVSRKGIIQVETTFKEKKDRNILEEVITRLCVEKLMEKNKPKVVGEIVVHPMPFKFKGNQLTTITENLMKDYIKNMLKNKKNQQIQQNIPVEQSHNPSVRESNTKVIIQNPIPDMSLLNEINARLSGMKNLDEAELVDKIVKQLQNKMTININLNQDKKTEQQPLLQSIHNDQIEIGGKKEDKEEVKDINKSEYINPFEHNEPIDYDEANIPYPYLYNLNEYELSESSSYITDTARISVQEPIIDEFSSEYNSSYSYTRSIPKTEQTPSKSYITEESSTISININKRLVDLNNNEYLKTLNLYDSDEHKLFQRNFGQRMGGFESDRSEVNHVNIQQENQQYTQMTQRFDSGRSNNVMFSFGNDRNVVERFKNDMSERLGIDLIYSDKGLHINNTISEDSESNVSNTISAQPERVYRTDESSSIYTNND
jgi:hypothetical protein